MIQVLTFLKRYAWLFGFILVAVIVMIITGGMVRPKIGAELKAVQAANKADKLVAELGHEKAIQAIEIEHKEALQKLNDVQQQQATELRDDPAKLASYLAKVAAGKTA